MDKQREVRWHIAGLIDGILVLIAAGLVVGCMVVDHMVVTGTDIVPIARAGTTTADGVIKRPEACGPPRS